MQKDREMIRSSAAEFLTFVTATGESDVSAVYADENVWLTQKMMGLLYNVETNTINYHLKKLFSDGEIDEKSVIRKFRITAQDGKTYNTNHYNLKAMSRYELLHDAGRISAAIAEKHALTEFQKYRVRQDSLYESDFDRFLLDDIQ